MAVLKQNQGEWEGRVEAATCRQQNSSPPSSSEALEDGAAGLWECVVIEADLLEKGKVSGRRHVGHTDGDIILKTPPLTSRTIV